jgi:hypothetical protein
MVRPQQPSRSTQDLTVIVPFFPMSIRPGTYLATPTSVTRVEAGLDLSRGSMSTRKSRSRAQKLAPRCASNFPSHLHCFTNASEVENDVDVAGLQYTWRRR